MSNPFAEAIAKAAGAAPMASTVVVGRVLLVDGDGLCYYCAGNDETEPGTARANLLGKIDSARRACGAERVIILVTASGSIKGHRYAIARVKPYQGQRTNSQRPKNWRVLREYLEAQDVRGAEVEITTTAEADDLFGWWAYNYPDDVVIYTQDKDMRMLPGLHLDWVSHRVHKVDYFLDRTVDKYRAPRVRAIDSVFNDKQYGPKWFWLQMLHGDTADHIPGLPKYKVRDGVLKPVGEVTAGKLLDIPMIADGYANTVAAYYKGYYGDRWLVEMIEQACLLWMRRDPNKWDDCMDPGGPLEIFNDGEAVFAQAYFEIERRVREADVINDQAKDYGSSNDTPPLIV